MTIPNLARLLARADLCRFVAACYYEPAPEFTEERLFDSMAAAADLVDARLAAGARSLYEAYAADSIDDLLVDYARLFLGPGDMVATPYGSSWLTGQKALMQDTTVALLDLYAEGGFEMDETFRELPDHVAAELEFLYLLLHRMAEAAQRGDEDAYVFADRLRERLVAEHIGRWAAPFAGALRTGAGTAFYRELADVTEQLIACEVRASGDSGGRLS